MHAGVAHVFFNSLSMLIFGPAVERIFTRWAFWIVFALGGAAASLGSLLWRTAHSGPGLSLSVGASGAIFALGGALLAGAFRLRHRLAPGRARALGAALLFLLGQGLVSGFTRLGTDNFAHATGLVAGAALGAVIPLSARLQGPRAALRGARARGGLRAGPGALARARPARRPRPGLGDSGSCSPPLDHASGGAQTRIGGRACGYSAVLRLVQAPPPPVELRSKPQSPEPPALSNL